MVEVLLADFTHIQQITRLMQEHRKDVTATKELTFDYKLCVEGLIHAIEDNRHIILVALRDGKVIGYLWLMTLRPHFSPVFYLSEAYFFVTKKERGGRAFAMLLQEAIQCGKLLGCAFLQLGATSGNEATTNIFRKRFESVGEIFRLSLQ
jgi:GNAT superfamily N-acetyltransferase